MEFSKAIQLKYNSNNEIRISKDGYICLTDMAACFPDKDIKDWIYNKSTFDFINVWERKNNANWQTFKQGEFPPFKNSTLTFKRLSSLGSLGIVSKQGRYGGTYAHKHIAFEFAMWLSPEFKLWVIEEFERIGTNQKDWDFNRYLAKQGYKMQTSAIKDKMQKHNIDRNIYAEEADMLNIIVFGKEANGTNPREKASVDQLTVLGLLENKNATYIELGISREKRYSLLINMYNEKFRKLNQQALKK